MMKKILLAGGAGYIGTELCKRLLRLDYKVTVIDDLWFGNNLDPRVERFTVSSLREIRFDLQKNGYLITAVDSAIEKLEDIFAQRELEQKLITLGYGEFVQELNALKELLTSRISRKKGHKFDRRRWPNQGYSVKQVDQLCSQLATHLAGTLLVSAKDVRLSVFKTKRGGYAEHQVDAFIDKFVELIQRETVLQKASR